MKQHILPEIRRVTGRFQDLENAIGDMPIAAQRDLLRLVRDQNQAVDRAKRDVRRGFLR